MALCLAISLGATTPLTLRPACGPVEGVAAVDESPESDNALVALIAGGDRSALGRLYDRYGPSLLALGQRTLRSRALAEDVLHDVFVEVWQLAGDYDARRGSVKAWLFLRMRSRGIDKLRLSSAKEVELEKAGLSAVAAQPAEDPTLGPDRQLVRRALEGLPAEQRAAIELAYFGGLSGSQIAERLGAPLGTIKTRLALGLSKLRAAFADTEASR
jgi:RNA polymerase sigma-70 factor (ECF subfamily)